MNARRRGASLAGVCFVAVWLVGGCSSAEQPKAPPAGETADGSGHDLPLKEFMGHVIAYSAQNIWDQQGWITDKTGERSIFPKNSQEWEDAESASLTLAELIGILLQPGRRMNVSGWDSSVLLIRKLAIESASAAERHDEAAFMQIGTEINEACDACHQAVGIK